MTDFLDYDAIALPGGREYYRLRGEALPKTACCQIRPTDGGCWERKTRWVAKGSTRYQFHATLTEALAAGLTRARRRLAEDRRYRAEQDRVDAAYEARQRYVARI